MPSMEPPVQVTLPAACNRSLTQADADAALAALQGRMAATRFISAEPGPAGTCWVKVHLENGEAAYADPAGRYFFYGVVFDLTSNKTLDNGGAVPDTKGESK